MTDRAWYDGIDIDDVDAAADRIRHQSAGAPHDWPTMAVTDGVAESIDAYHEHLRAAALAAFEAEIEAFAGAVDRELVQLVRTLDATTRIEHELRQHVAEAVTEASATTVSPGDLDSIVDALDTEGAVLADALGGIVESLDHLQPARDHLEEVVVRQALAVAPNLSALAGPMLAARLIAAAGSLEDLARMPSSTLQVLGAEGALFAHLRGEASSPKHGLIFTHPAVRSSPGDVRGTVARVLAGKLTIAARVDHYRGELEPTLEAELTERLTAVTGGEV